MIKPQRLSVMLLLLTTLASVNARAQAAAVPSVVVSPASWSSLSYTGPELRGQAGYARQSVLRSTGWRTAIFAVAGAS